MHIIAKRSYHFRDVRYEEEILESGKKQLKEILIREHKCQASTNPQLVPDWVENTDLFKVALDDYDKQGREMLVIVAEKKNKKSTPEPEAPKMGWGATPATNDGLTV